MKLYALFISLTFSSLALANPSGTPLLPEVKDIITVKPINEASMDQNSYVHLMAMDAAHDNYLSVGKNIILHTNKMLIQSIQNKTQTVLEDEKNHKIYDYNRLTPKLSINQQKYQFPCDDLNEMHCIPKALETLQLIAESIKKYKPLLTRYQQAMQQPIYDRLSPMTLSSPIPPFGLIMQLSWLRQLEAIEAINQGNIQHAMTLLEQETNFAKKMLAGNSEFIDKQVAIRMLFTQYHTISELLDHPNLQKSLMDPRLIALLNPLTLKEQQAMANGIKNELASQLILFETMDEIILNDYYRNLPHNSNATKQTINTVKYYDKNQTLNSAFLKQQPIINYASITLPAAQLTYPTLLNYQQKPLCKSDDPTEVCIAKIQQQHGDNLIGGILLNITNIDHNYYLFRFYDLSSYLALIRTKLWINQQSIPKAQIPTFLSTLGNMAKNPYTQIPFKWDAQTSTLSTESTSCATSCTQDKLFKIRLSF